MLEVRCQEYFEKVQDEAKKMGLLDKLKERLDYLNLYATDGDLSNTKCELYSDFAPLSFYFVMYKKKNDEYRQWFGGGLIFHASGSNGTSFPEFSTSLGDCSSARWEIHT